MQITAAVVHEPGANFTLQAVELDEPRADEILVRIAAVGVCHTDLVARDGVMPFSMPAVLGHEGAGTVEKVGAAANKLPPGDRVALPFRPCGSRRPSRRGHPPDCSTIPTPHFLRLPPCRSHA